MNYKEYLEFRDLYVNNKEKYDDLLNKKISEVFLSADRFFDAFGTELLTEEDYCRKAENIEGIVDEGLLRRTFGIGDSVEEDTRFMKFFLSCLEFQLLYLQESLSYRNIKKYIKCISAIMYDFQEIPSDYPMIPEMDYFYYSFEEQPAGIEIPDSFRYHYCPFDWDVREEEYGSDAVNDRSLNRELTYIYDFTQWGYEMAIKENYRIAAWIYRDNYDFAVKHILASLSALFELSHCYDRYFTEESCFDFDYFKRLFPDFETQKEVLMKSTADQLEAIYTTADSIEIKRLIDSIRN